MAHGHNPNEKVIFVGDSRVRKPKTPGADVIPPDYTAFPGKSEAFIPNFLLKEWMVGSVVLLAFLVLTIAEPAPLGYPADPTNAAFIPMPDWYFLFLYQFLKYPYASGDYVAFGIIGVPGVAFGALLLAPFLDTGKERRFTKRPVATALMILSLFSLFYLTKVSWDHYEYELKINNSIPEHIDREEKALEAIKSGQPQGDDAEVKEVAIVAPDDPAMEIIKANCVGCHATDLKGQGNFPPLRGVGDKYSKEELVGILNNGKNGAMPSFKGKLTDEQIDQVTTWLSKQKAE